MSEKKDNPKTAIIGAGAVGSLIGALLARYGYDITLIGKKAHIDSICKNGLYVSGALGDFNVAINASEKLDFKPDILFICVKVQDLISACSQITKYASDSLIVTVQNGIHADAIVSEQLGTKRIIGVVVQFNAQYLEPGRVIYGAKGPVIIGDSFGSNGAELKQIEEMLAKIFSVTESRNLSGARYSKLLVNVLANSLGALSGLTATEYMKFREYRRLGALLMREAFRVIKKAGIKLESIPGLAVRDVKLLDRLPVFLSSSIIAGKTANGPFAGTKPSTLQSLLRDKTTEVDAINGEIVRLAEASGEDAVYSGKVIEQCRILEKEGHYLSPDEISEIFFKE